MLEDLSGFFRSFGSMTDGFRERAERVNALLESSASAFVARHLAARRRDRRGALLPPPPGRGRPALRRRDRQPRPRRRRPRLGVRAARPARRRAARAARSCAPTTTQRALAERDQANLDELRRRLRRRPLLEVPVLDGDVHDLDGLAAHERAPLRRASLDRGGEVLGLVEAPVRGRRDAVEGLLDRLGGDDGRRARQRGARGSARRRRARPPAPAARRCPGRSPPRRAPASASAGCAAAGSAGATGSSSRLARRRRSRAANSNGSRDSSRMSSATLFRSGSR